ncbi:hypothetical protein K501DRAFT_277706 [Backusella circina FSU 941]|nr:hypothetical protein K501DRAFT_277706 [Backusella circina FSU 941]
MPNFCPENMRNGLRDYGSIQQCHDPFSITPHLAFYFPNKSNLAARFNTVCTHYVCIKARDVQPRVLNPTFFRPNEIQDSLKLYRRVLKFYVTSGLFTCTRDLFTINPNTLLTLHKLVVRNQTDIYFVMYDGSWFELSGYRDYFKIENDFY